MLDSDAMNKDSYPEDSDVSHESCSTLPSATQGDNGDHLEQRQWTSLQYTEAMSVLNTLLRSQHKKCKNCGASNPRISRPNFGLFHVSGMSDDDVRRNVLQERQLGGLLAGELEEVTDVEDTIQTSGRKTNATKHRKKKQEKAPREFRKQKNALSRKLLPSEVKNIIEQFWEKEAQLCSYLSDIQQQGLGRKKAGSSMFFLQTVLVPPIKFRPPTKGGDSTMEHPQTVLLNKVLQSNISLGAAYTNKEPLKIVGQWWELQQSINMLYDSKTAKGGPGQKDASFGICQILERKEGLFRQKMMGKRVNYACRSVISPDPYLDVNEIGIPPCFAVKLTYPERVTPWNASELRNAVINGSENHPGATHYVDRLSMCKLPAKRKARISVARKLPSSIGAVMQWKGSDTDYEGKIVYRHLRDGDIVLVNRQPTLHKISMMAHKVRVLKGEKTLRMHYANCSTYNADFDGDEMNVHFPQDEVSRAEAYNIVNANNQYVKPSNGEPIRGLIQDHIVSAALLTNMDSFLTGDQFAQILHSSGVFGIRQNFFGKPDQKVSFSCSEDEIQIPPPAISKPVDLWTGKQVITALLNHITKDHPPFTVEKGGKIPHDFFKSRDTQSYPTNNGRNGEDKASKKIESVKVNRRKKLSCEDKIFIKDNYVVQGVIDKAQFGEYGFVHTVQELYGSDTAGILLSALSRLFTAFLQMHGFTCGVDDLLILKAKDDERKNQLEYCEKSGELVHRHFIGIKDENIKIDPLALQLNIEKTIRSDGESAVAYLDRQMTNEINSKTSCGVINELLSEGLLKPSGKNCISLMTTSGAKGSKVNFQQISSFLGQQELEGKRVPRMVSGKTLPCFHPWDWDARAGGFIIDRFLTGLRPQEYYFHCMGGREWLVDTAVKTSRSGYLQRCLIKILECLKISYDHTVRDADGSIVQFCYGEDGVDVHQTSFIAKFEALTANQEIVRKKYNQLEAFNSYIVEPTDALKDKAKHFLNLSKNNEANGVLNKKAFNKLVKQKYFSSLAQPGEPVGVLAAQSVGEPSTQMTLNTFHLAGRGENNVTLGIPRLQEILMTASSDIKTPIMTCPLQRGRTEKNANRLLDKLKKVTIADIIESMEISVVPLAVHNDDVCRIYKLKMKLYKPAHYPQYADISVEDWEETLEVLFVRQLEDAIQSHLVLLSRISGIKDVLSETNSKASNEIDEDVNDTLPQEENDDENDERGVDDIGLDAEKRKLQETDEMEYDDGLDEESVEDEETVEDEELVEDKEESSAPENEIIKEDILDPGISESPGLQNSSEAKLRGKASKSQPQNKKHSKQQSSDRAQRKKRIRAKLIKKDFDRAIFVEAKGFDFSIHFKFTNEPHILLAEIAQKTATKVYIQNPGNIERCRVTNCKENQVIYYGEDPKKRVDVEPAEKEKIPALHTTGVDFNAFWEMQDRLDVRYLYSNSIHAILKTYGVEAARETIIREVKHVFGSYGISVNTRHLALIADFMTHTGGYRPMSRLGGIAESISPFSKMTFETASKFIVGAALHGESDNLEAPSASICLGLPVKMGTGSFGLMQKVEF